ncbi:dihydrofolate reductase [Rubricoccus marinus]|uniref:dihydrofolate reductase n=1 Tax=Rubricoccus marinus TaxID=716817 RepID=UPI000B998B60|nr:dihydrofolate reductase [Rubricoccus marinus]
MNESTQDTSPQAAPEASGAEARATARPEVVVIAAVAEAPGTESDRLIGDGLELPWHLPVDFRRFKTLTTGHPLIMGRKTFESLLHQNGGPLPNRENVVLTRHPTRVDHPGIHVYGSLPLALEAFADAERVFIGGGAGVYGSVLEDGLADRLELTLVEGEFSGDTYFPPYRHLLEENGGPFELAERQKHPAADGRPAFRFDTYVRR